MNVTYEKELTVVTPERVQLHYQTAGIGSRGLAQMLDGLLLSAFNVLILFAAAAISGLLGSSMDSWSEAEDYLITIMVIAAVIVNFGYYVAMEYYNGGQTLGKRWLGIRVLQNNGQSTTFLSVLIRNIFRLVDFLPTFYFVGMAIMLFSKRDKRLGDMVAGTIVVVELQRERLKQKQVLQRKLKEWESMIPSIKLPDTVGAQIGYDDWALLSAYIERLPDLTDLKAAELAMPIARHFAAKLTTVELSRMSERTFLIWLYVQLREEWEI